MRPRTTALRFVFLACFSGTAFAQQSGAIPFPEGYRNWYVDHSTVGLQGHTPESEVGIQHVYANPAALKGLETGHAKGQALVIRIDVVPNLPLAQNFFMTLTHIHAWSSLGLRLS
jgi:hypothetical protein